MKRASLFVAAGVALLSWVCAAASTTSPPLDCTFDLRAGTSTQVEGTDLEVRFEGVRNDSRCPPDVKCISAGDATVALRLAGGGKDATTYELHTPRGQKEAEHGSYVVSLVGLGPPPASSRQTSAEDYVATVRVRRRD
ncbi:MAG TPA: hypothetical protein VE359_02205 [Vicinamibacteria bacterium]|nr:hypothetical protein [Vicinamibacteria bacterium]